jgi:hypothetical protein
MARKGVSHSSACRCESSAWLIEIPLRELRQLFHHLDPAAEAYIEDAMREVGTRKTVKLLVYLPEAARPIEEARTLPDAVAPYFSYRAAPTPVELPPLA